MLIAANMPYDRLVRPQATTPAPPWAGALALGALGFMIAWYAAVIARQWLQTYDRDVALAWKRKGRGDRAGAIADLRGAIAAKGPSAKRSNGLGMLLAEEGEWEEARRAFEEAFALDPENSRGNLGIALLNTGDPAGAELLYRPLIEQIRRASEPRDLAEYRPVVNEPVLAPLALANYARILSKLDRHDEAGAYFDRAEAALEKYLYLAADLKDLVRSEIADGRAKLAELRGIKKDGIDLFPEL
ncbi:MAG: tetratricopeptide repeat protein [Isosphaeraceae bacterium]